ncbi:ABC transporter permease subunit [Bartonella sp. HY329]|uniref:ABC transporter permease subunit n=1 Tax=unclassified Bartonella TaxID=2645622 RepID=UPI0021C7EFD2|nr:MULTISPECIES: ABC transporter permease subunit [unclassified Bartonella]UXM95839.1 ABC transporter permease subunit [Bartonella sp. HY329]UXN10164.1 ABC transporter permease subunit [Bartonella sp. HY328]
MSFDSFYNTLTSILPGLQLTVLITVAAFFLGQLLALPFALALYYKSPIFYWPVAIYTFMTRGSPLLIQLFIFYNLFGKWSSALAIQKNTIFWFILNDAKYCAIFVIGLNSASYMAVILLGALRQIPQGQNEAATSLGLNSHFRLFDILLPQVYRNILPTIGNEMIIVLKGSSLASVITIMDVFSRAKSFMSNGAAAFDAFFAAAILYLCLGFIIAMIFKLLEYYFLPASITGHRTK